MSTLRRVTRFYTDTAPDAAPYDVLCEALAAEAATWLGTEAIEGWPTGQWEGEERSVLCSEWRPDAPAGERLLHLKLRQNEPDGQALTVEATLGCDGSSPPFLVESWLLAPTHRPLTLASLPRLFNSLATHDPRDEDGLLPGRRYLVSAERVPALVEFVSAPTRRLPLLLLSPTRDGDLMLGPSAAFLAATRSLAHVMLLHDEAAVEAWSAHLPAHRCYDGAVRLYWPAFQPGDRPQLHPFRTAREIERLGDEAIEQALFEQLTGHAARLFAQVEELADLEQAKEFAFHQQQAELRQKRALLDDVPDMEALYYEIEAERDQFRNRVEELEQEVHRLREELRQQRWKQHSQLAGRAESEEEEPTATLYLSAEARRTWRGWDATERDYWRRHLFPKLLQPEARQAQMVPVGSKEGQVWAYPRSRTGDGRRLFFALDAEQLFVYDLFPAIRHDEYNRLRVEGLDTARYSDFQPWSAEDE